MEYWVKRIGLSELPAGLMPLLKYTAWLQPGWRHSHSRPPVCRTAISHMDYKSASYFTFNL
jgi:hypothetical protein